MNDQLSKLLCRIQKMANHRTRIYNCALAENLLVRGDALEIIKLNA